MKYILLSIALSCATLHAASTSSKEVNELWGPNYTKHFKANILPKGMPAVIAEDERLQILSKDPNLSNEWRGIATGNRLQILLNCGLSDAQKEELKKAEEARAKKKEADSAKSTAAAAEEVNELWGPNYTKHFKANILPKGMPAVIAEDERLEILSKNPAIGYEWQAIASGNRNQILFNCELSDAQKEELKKAEEARAKNATDSAKSAAPAKK